MMSYLKQSFRAGLSLVAFLCLGLLLVAATAQAQQPTLPASPTACDYTSEPANISLTAQNVPAGYSTIYLLVNMTSGMIVQTNPTAPVFNGVSRGLYYAVPAHYSGSLNNALAGKLISDVYSTDQCLTYGTTLGLRVCASPGSCDYASAPTNVTFTANNVPSGVTTTYVLVDESTNLITKTSSTPAFSGLTKGDYAITSVHYTGSLTALAAGNSLYSVTTQNANCLSVSNTIHIRVCNSPIAITGPVDGTTVASLNPPISGTATPGASVTVTGGPGSTGGPCITTADVNGNWTCTNLTFPAGPTSVTATDGTTTAVSHFTTTSPTSPPTVVVSGPANTTTTTTPVIAGTATPGSIVTLTDPQGTTLCSTTVTAGGAWSCAVAVSPGSTTLTATACNLGGCTTATTSFTVAAPLLSPVVTPDIANTSPGKPVSGNVLTNDSDPQGGPLTASVTTQPATGTVTMSPTGSYTYTPPAGFTGTVSFCYTATNTAGLSGSSCVSINVIADPSPVANDAPIANNDNTQTTAATSLTVAVLANDTDPDAGPPDSATSLNGQLSNPTIVSPPSVGTAVVNANGTVTYTPPANFTGVVSFPYQVCDQATPALCATAVVTVGVQPTPPVGTTLSPVAVDDALLTQVNVPKTGTVATNDSDPQGLPLTYSTGQPASGTVVMSPTGSFTYTPAAGYVGPTSFTYSVCNSANKCDVASVSVDVQVPGGLIVLPKAWLQGALFSVTATSGIMRDDLRLKGYLPLSSPYTSFTALTPTPALSSSAVFATTGNDAIVDWVYVELRSPSSSSTVVDSRAALIQRDGDIVELDGVSPMIFSKASPGNYYVAVRHRNHLGAMTSTALPLSATGTVVDFRIPDTVPGTSLYYRATTSAINQAQVTVAQGVALWAGNVLYDKTVIYQSTSNDVAAISVQVKQQENRMAPCLT